MSTSGPTGTIGTVTSGSIGGTGVSGASGPTGGTGTGDPILDALIEAAARADAAATGAAQAAVASNLVYIQNLRDQAKACRDAAVADASQALLYQDVSLKGKAAAQAGLNYTYAIANQINIRAGGTGVAAPTGATLSGGGAMPVPPMTGGVHFGRRSRSKQSKKRNVSRRRGRGRGRGRGMK